MTRAQSFTDQLVTDIENLPDWIRPVFMWPIVLIICLGIWLTRGSDRLV